MGWIFAIDTYLEGNVESGNRVKAFENLLDHTLAVLWNDPDNQRTPKFLRPFLHDRISSTDEMKSLVEKYQSDLLHARHKTKSLMDVRMRAIPSAFCELWIEYCEHVPAEFVVREAETILAYFTGSLMEMYLHGNGIVITDVNELTFLRRATIDYVPFIMYMDLFISTLKDSAIPLILNKLFYGPEMQCILVAATDTTAVMNDIYSFEKDVIGTGEESNLVLIAC